MDDVASDIVSGLCCELCSSYYERQHGYPVVCRACWSTLTDSEKKNHQLATEQELSDDTDPVVPMNDTIPNPDKLIAGYDEVGMGSVAGPACVAVVVIGEGVVAGVRDSKKCNRMTRSLLAVRIKDNAKFWHIATRSHTEIDTHGLIQCWTSAMIECRDKVLAAMPGVESLADAIPDRRADFNALKGIRFVSRGDDTIYSIGAASIVAKDHRDNLMLRYAEQYPGYGFENHVGYGTPEHWTKIKELGVCPIHREGARKNKVVVKNDLAPFDPHEAHRLLGEVRKHFAAPWMGEWERGFLQSLDAQLETKRSISQKQMFYLINTARKVLKEARKNGC